MSQRPRGRRPVQEITEPQRRTLKEIRLFTNRRGFPPTMKELADILGISHASVHGQVNQLVRKGYLKREPRKARGITIVREPEDDISDLVAVPIIGRVAAGQPILAEENIIGEVLVEGRIARAGRCFALEVTGDSMVDAGIRERDLVVVRQQPVAENGDIVVALLEDEATVKRLYIRGERIELRPENREHRPVPVGPDFQAVLDGQDANIHDCENSHIVVTNIQQLASRADRWLPAFPDDFFNLILVDEGHHNVARSWERVFERFPNAKVVSLTATPFRGDGREIASQRVYAYPFRTAMVRGYIKQITAVNVAPEEISFTYRGDARRHTLEEVLQLRDEEWFSRGVALAPECNRSIVDASIQWLQHLRETDTFHQLIAVACSVDHTPARCGPFTPSAVCRRVKSTATCQGGKPYGPSGDTGGLQPA